MDDKDVLINPNNVKFMDLLHICIKNFRNPRIRGSHHIFKTPWPDIQGLIYKKMEIWRSLRSCLESFQRNEDKI
jgi:hypothetical protein